MAGGALARRSRGRARASESPRCRAGQVAVVDAANDDEPRGHSREHRGAARARSREAMDPGTLTATYRVQMNKDFRLADARAIVPYLDALGISHLYASPMLAARPGSMHGYDVTDPTRLNPELGTEEELRTLAAELRERGMGIVLDIVPNHMGTGPANPFWEDLLANGRRSPSAHWFDVDWESERP